MPLQRNTEEWQALLTYRNSLVQGEHEIHPITLKQAAQKRYGKRKQAGHAEGRYIFWLLLLGFSPNLQNGTTFVTCSLP